MDIIVTTPKSRMAEAAREAAACIAAGGGDYFRRFPPRKWPVHLNPGDRVYYVEDGAIRGFAVVDCICDEVYARDCDTTARRYPPGLYVMMRADSWCWIRPIPMRGFQGFRYVRNELLPDGRHYLEIVGFWRDPRPEIEK